MQETPIKKPPNWVVRTSGGLYTLLNFLISGVVLGIPVGLFVNWVFSVFTPPPYLNFFIVVLKWAIELGLANPIVVVLISFILYLLHLLAKQYLRGYIPLSDKEIEHDYLKCMVMEKEMHALGEMPTDLIPQSVKLEDVFIPLQFHLSNQSMIDHPLTKAELDAEKLPLREKELLGEGMKKNWENEDNKTIAIADLWQSLKKDKPFAVIKGYPGTGKSTLVNALILRMAYNCLNRTVLNRFKHLIKGFNHLSKQPDQLLPLINAPLVPILFNLGEYANKRAEVGTLPLEKYLKDSAAQWNIRGLDTFLEKSLKKGRCLVLLDGLNEIVYNRKEVLDDIKKFIADHSTRKYYIFNRFLITSRTAGYNPHDFTDYLHYKIAELEDGQIQKCLYGWFCAIKRNPNTVNNRAETEENIIKEATSKAEVFLKTLKEKKTENQRVYEFAKKPLHLTLLVLMHQRFIKLPGPPIELPRRRVELYRRVTSLLLEKRKDAHGQPVFSKEKAMQYLGPLALWMQETGKSWPHQDEVRAKLKETFGAEKISDDEIEAFLTQVREEGGLFAYRTEVRLGFPHRIFQEYFIARYLLKQVKGEPVKGLEELINKARQPNDLWREPFLLAVAHQSYNDITVANQIINELLNTPEKAEIEDKMHDICLAASCLIEAQPFSIEEKIEEKTAGYLLDIYEEALQSQNIEVCKQISEAIRRWSQCLSGSAEYPPLHVVLRNRAKLTLLPLFVEHPASCLQLINKILITPPLRDANMSVLTTAQSAIDNSTASSLNVANDRKEDTVAEELQQFAQTICKSLMALDNIKGFKAVLDIVRCSVVYSVNEVKFLFYLIEETDNEQIRQACIESLRKANPSTCEAKALLDIWQWVCKTYTEATILAY